MKNEKSGFPQEKPFDMIIYIGRFQPFHVAHKKTIDKALSLSNKVLILVGSAENSTSPKNPFTFNQREQMITDHYSSGFQSVTGTQLFVEPVKDHTYDDPAWVLEVSEMVEKHTQYDENPRIGVVGHDKDHSSFYLNWFPQWEFISVPSYPESGESIDATKIRNLLFSDNIQFISGVVPDNVFSFLFEFYESSIFIKLQHDWKFNEQYKQDWAGSPYPPIFVTVDSVVVQSGHVLLIERGADSGVGLWAMAGGFIDQFELLENAAVRELVEETKIKLQEDVLHRSITQTEVFDSPNRSSRGRTITHAYLFELNDAKPLPKVKGADDAAKAQWFSFAEFQKMESVMFEDHFHIVKHMLNLV